uniref:G-protein coupled receptors family 1 profile domain-containing protein n=1 Tax=Trichobilharzia regenti TaxID=157069 RepID=A0AA85KGB7_TRIRE|nr:unnamed protein product [Trichobilharzia regenti]
MYINGIKPSTKGLLKLLTMQVVTNWTEFFSRSYTLAECTTLEHGDPNNSELLCKTPKVLGILTAYVFPPIGVFNLIANTLITIAFLYPSCRNSRHLIFLGVLALCDIGITITVGWLGLFPTYGLPYAASGRVYYFILTRSSISCKLITFYQAFCCILRGNLFVLTGNDRCILMYKPMLYKQVSKYPIWILLVFVSITAFLMTLPIVLYTDVLSIFNFTTCWYTSHHNLLQLYQSLFSNTCLAQLSVVTVFDVFYLVKMIKWSRDHRQRSNDLQSSLEMMKHISSTITLLLLHITALLSALPSGICVLLTTIVFYRTWKLPVELIRLTALIVSIEWLFLFLLSSLNIFIFYARIQRFQEVVRSLIVFNLVKKTSITR